jgi:hypothetical protein
MGLISNVTRKHGRSSENLRWKTRFFFYWVALSWLVVGRHVVNILDTVNDGGFESLPPAWVIWRYVITSRWSCRLEPSFLCEDYVCCGSPVSTGLRLLRFYRSDSAAQLNSMLCSIKLLRRPFDGGVRLARLRQFTVFRFHQGDGPVCRLCAETLDHMFGLIDEEGRPSVNLSIHQVQSGRCIVLIRRA